MGVNASPVLLLLLLLRCVRGAPYNIMVWYVLILIIDILFVVSHVQYMQTFSSLGYKSGAMFHAESWLQLVRYWTLCRWGLGRNNSTKYTTELAKHEWDG